ncbi:MAG: SDR family oxidoreductase [Actinomycetota bacterium]|nr:SDR family oxidoreductase [Actinomycetota bacterium]
MGQIVVVTGASAGVGRATAVAYGARGDTVALLARGRAGLEAARREVEAAGGRALVVPTDVADAAQVEAAAARVERELGPIDVWVNSAMAAVLAEVGQTEPEEFRRVVEVTFLGSVYGTMAALKRMGPRDRGTIVQVGSALAYRGIPLQASYCGAKHGLQGFFESLRVELLHQGSNLRYTMVQLPGLNTPQFTWVRVRGLARRPRPVAPVYQPEVAARAIVWASEHGRREVWVGGATVGTILGSRLAPWFADRVLARTNYEGQQTDEPLEPDRRDYLFAPLDDDEDRGTRGPFAGESASRSLQLRLRMHRGAAWGAAAGLLAAAGVARARAG